MKTKFRPLRDAKEPVETRVYTDCIGRHFIEYLTTYGAWEYVREMLPGGALVPVEYKSLATAKRIATWAKAHITTKADGPVNILILAPVAF